MDNNLRSTRDKLETSIIEYCQKSGKSRDDLVFYIMGIRAKSDGGGVEPFIIEDETVIGDPESGLCYCDTNDLASAFIYYKQRLGDGQMPGCIGLFHNVTPRTNGHAHETVPRLWVVPTSYLIPTNQP